LKRLAEFATADVYRQNGADSLNLARTVDQSLAALVKRRPRSIQVYK
jgi:hypothetical protein